jgi:hypothetical protein
LQQLVHVHHPSESLSSFFAAWIAQTPSKTAQTAMKM